MHPLHDHLARQLAERLKARRVVVWYDPRREFAPFIEELRGGPAQRGTTSAVPVGDERAQLAEYDDSFFELRAIIEPLTTDDIPKPVLIYVPGMERDRRGSVLMELEKIGEQDGHLFGQSLKQVARNVLRQRYTDGVIDEILAPERITYQDLARAASDSGSAEPPSILRAIFHDVSGNDAILATWIVSNSRDGEIEAKDARRELVKLIRSRIGLELPDEAPFSRLRAISLRYVLIGEFCSDLRCPVPEAFGGMLLPSKKEEESAVRGIAHLLRSAHGDEYPALADRIETELGLAGISLPSGALGAIDTFRFEEGVLLDHCGDLIAEGKNSEALDIMAERENSFWLTLDVNRKAQWEACRRMAELGRIAEEVKAFNGKGPTDASGWIEAYTRKDGLYRLDQAQRRLETWVAHLEEEPQEKPLGVVRRAYDDACSALTDRFCRAFEKARWTVPGILHQTHVYTDAVASRPKPVAYFLIDALRFEMGLELVERLPKTAEATIRPALAALPSITPIGMAALLPGASANFGVVEQKGKLGARIDGVFLPDLGSRRKLLASRVPGAVDLALDELLSLQVSKLAKLIAGAPLIIVRSQEIDQAGETGFTFQARQVMDTVIDNLVRAIKKLAAQGVEHSVVTADHGHLFFPIDRDESMRIDPPGGQQVALHRRCWIGRGGSTPSGCIRVEAAALGYESDLDFVFPSGTGVFRAGGDLAYHHGGPSLQEVVVPVLGVRLKVRGEERVVQSPVFVSSLPEVVTNRIFSVVLKLDSLFPVAVKALLTAAGQQVGAVGMVINADLDRASGNVTLQPGQEATIAFILNREEVPALRVVVQDPATDAELYRSPKDIPVRLGV